MSPNTFDNALRGLASGGSRRSALAGLLGAAFAVVLPGESGARRFGDPRKRKRKSRKDRDGKRKNKNKNRKRDRKNKNRHKDKNRKRHRSGDKGTSKGCKAKHSEQEILRFIHKAAKKYGQSEHAMVRVARCESSLDPCAYNRSGPYYGLFQFLKSTWKDTPYKSKSIYDPKAQAFAAAWMWKQGRKDEWACK